MNRLESIRGAIARRWSARDGSDIVGTAMFIMPYDLKPVVDAAASVGARLCTNAAHPMGLIAGGDWQNPLDAAPTC